jgi:multimeric flavodoxin WrbA
MSILQEIKMKITAFCGSARKEGNTALLLKAVLAPLESAGFETELVEFAGENISGCKACMGCFKNKNRKCVFDDDVINDCIEKMLEADAILLGSPTYFADISTEMKALIDRSGMVARANENMFRRKLGAAVIAARRAGAIHAFDSINHFFLIGEMIIVGSSYWNIGHGRQKGEVSEDVEGLGTMKTLGENLAWLLNKIDA